MNTYIKLQFTDGKIIPLFTSSLLYKQSKLIQAFDIDEDNINQQSLDDGIFNIPIICPSSYISNNIDGINIIRKLDLISAAVKYTNATYSDIDDTNLFIFTLSPDLMYMFTLLPDNFINLCKFLNILCYENKDILFSREFIKYLMKHKDNDIFSHEIKDYIYTNIHYFMKDELISIMNYINNVDIDIQIRTCTIDFYFLYLSEYKEEVVKNDRYDIYEITYYRPDYSIGVSISKEHDIDVRRNFMRDTEFYPYIHKYNNKITHFVTNSSDNKYYQYYLSDINTKLINVCQSCNNIEPIMDLINKGADIKLTTGLGNTLLHIAAKKPNNLNVIQYLVEHGVNIYLTNNSNNTVFHYAAQQPDNLNVIRYLIEYSISNNISFFDPLNPISFYILNEKGYSVLHIASQLPNNLNVIKYIQSTICTFNPNYIHLQDNYDGDTALHMASKVENNLNVIRYLIENGADIYIKNNYGFTLLHYAAEHRNNLNVIQYIVEHNRNINNKPSSFINLQNIFNYTALDIVLQNDNKQIANYLQNLVF